MKTAQKFIIGALLSIFALQPLLGNAQTNSPNTSTNVFPSYYTPIQLNPSAYSPQYGVSLLWPKNGEDGDRTWSQTKSMFFYAVGALGVIMLLPEESTGWEDSGGDLLKKWHENVKAGPEWDRNKWGYNYIGHAWVGGVYYQIARKSGYRQWDSFIYSALMSTFVWEYGIEAFAEVPSIQDLIYTPIAGWLYGEWAYQTEFKIRRNGKKVLGSRILGGTSLILLDPVDAAGSAVNWIFRRDLIKAGHGYFTYVPAKTDDGKTDHQVYFHVKIPIGPAGPDVKPDYDRYTIHDADAVNVGIIGFGAGLGHTAFDDHWDASDDIYTKLNLGLYFTPRISMRLAYAWGDMQRRSVDEIIEYENYSWDTQIYLRTENMIRPYVSGGFGHQVWEEDNDTANFQWNAGLGVHAMLHNKLALNADWINFYSPSQSTYDQQFNIGMIYRFGEGEHDRW